MPKFTFPVPGRRKQQVESPAAATQLTKAQKILGTGGLNTGSSATFTGSPAKQPQPWDARSGISIDISESSASYSVADTGLGRSSRGREDEGAAGIHHGGRGWDAESETLPRQLQSGNGLRTQRSAATIGHDYRTDASSLQRRQSNASTIYSHYDRSKVPLAISQQTSNSAMAKGLPSKASALLDVDGSLGGPGSKKKKPSRLDLSMLKPRGRRDQTPQAAALLGNNYVMRSPSFVSISSPQDTSRRLRKSPSTISSATYGSPLTLQDSTTLSQLYDHYEQMSFRSAPSPGEENTTARPCFDSVSEEPEPTPALTTASTISLVTPLSNPVVREPNRRQAHRRKDSTGSRNTVTTVSSPSIANSHQMYSAQDYAESISSRNTRTSKASKTLDFDLQSTSVLSLSDSESDDGTFSDSAPKSSLSSHTTMSHEDISLSADTRKATPSRGPVVQERTSSRQKHGNFAPLNDYLTVPGSAGKGHSARKPSDSTLRSYSSSGSTATATGKSGSESGLASRLSTSATETIESRRSQISHRKKTPQQQPSPPQQRQQRKPHSSHVAQEAKAITLMPLASTAEALDSLRELTAQATANHRRTLSSEQLTPPLSPASITPSGNTEGAKDLMDDDAGDAHHARLMAVTKQEEMLLAALRQKRAMMRENILAEFEGDKGPVMNHRASKTGSRCDSQGSGKSGNRISLQTASGAPQLPPFSPRNSPLVSSFKTLTERKDSVRRTENNVRFADESHQSIILRTDPIEKRSSSAMSNSTIKASNSAGRHERVFMFLDRPLHEFDAADAAEPSRDLSEFMDYGQDSDGEIVPERRRSRRASKFSSVYGSGHSTPAVRHGEERSKADANLAGVRGSSLRRQLEKLPESTLESCGEVDDDFDGFSDVMNPPRSDYGFEQGSKEREMARPDSPVRELAARSHSKGHVKGKTSAVRLSAVGNAAGSFLPPEVGLWGDDG